MEDIYQFLLGLVIGGGLVILILTRLLRKLTKPVLKKLVKFIDDL